MKSLPAGFRSEFLSLEGRFSFLARPGAWFWIAIAVGVALRAFLASATQGTTDVRIWSEFSAGAAERGLIGAYHINRAYNHPPLIAWVMAELWQLAHALGIEFRVLYRGIFAAADLASALLLLAVLRGSPWRFVACAGYSVAPIALALGTYHGNPGSLIAPCLLGSVLYASRQRPVPAGVLLGMTMWIKLPGLFAAPAIGFSFPRWRQRIVVALVTIAVGLSTYLPALVLDHQVVIDNIFSFRGYVFSTLSKPPTYIWGLKNLFIELWGYDPRIELWALTAAGQPERWPALSVSLVNHATEWALALMLVFAFLRRRENDARSLAQTVAGSYAIFYALSDALAFQYLAWSLPFWMCAGPLFALATNVFAGGYIWLVYAFVCDDWLLRPPWRFLAHPNWPMHLRVFRELALWTFVAFGAAWLVRAAVDEFRSRGAAAGDT